MAKYTTDLKTICEQHAIDKGLYTPDNIGNANPYELSVLCAEDGVFTKYGNSDFIIFDEDYRVPLITKILMKYYTREIGSETFGLFKLRFRQLLDEIMPYYNKLYESLLFEFNPLYTEDITRKTDGTRDVTGEDKNTRTDNTTQHNDTTSGGDNWNLYSDTPQGGIEGVRNATHEGDLVKNAYLTDARHTIDSGTNNNTVTNTGTVDNAGTNESHTTDDYTEKIYGYRGYSPNKLLKEFRANIINIDEMIMAHFKNLFMLLW